MNNPILFSIIMPTFNRAGFIGKAIKSVVDQTFINWELLIIDDGSTDNTKDIVSKFSDPRIRYIYQINKERSAARNNGIQKSSGDFICFLDSDDYYLDDFLAEFNKEISKNNFKNAFYFCNTFCEKSNGIIVKSGGANEYFSGNYDFLLNNTIGTPRVCLPSEILKKNFFDLQIRIGEDFELWMRLINDLEIKYIRSYTQVFLDHDERSINNNFVTQSLIAIELRIKTASKYRDKFSKEAFSAFKNQNKLKLARLYFGNNKVECIRYSIQVLLSGSYSKKEALFMIIKSI